MGISISYESGIMADPGSTKASGSLSYTFAYQRASQIGSFRNKSVKMTLVTPALHSAAMWAQRNSFTLIRSDGSLVANPLGMGDNFWILYVPQLPAPAASKPLRVRGRNDGGGIVAARLTFG